MNKQLISAALAVAFSIAGYAQSGTNSPYSQFGLGLLSDQSHGFNSGMNGVGMGYRSGDVVNTLNPASYSAIDSLTMVFDVGVTGQITSFKEGDTRLNAKNADFDYAVGTFRLLPKVGAAFGLLPFSTIGYSYSASNKLNDDYGTVTESYTGSGGLHEAFVGLGWNIVKPLSVGVNFSYIWGTYTRSVSSSSSTYINTLSKEYTANINTYGITLGAQWQQDLNQKDRLTFGATVGLGHEIKANPTCRIVNVNSVTSARDTTSFTINSGMKLPMTYGVGLGWNHGTKWFVGADVEMQKWGSVDFPDYYTGADGKATYALRSGMLKDCYKVNIGADYLPASSGRHLYQVIHYRFGAGYATPYYNINGQEGPKEVSVSAGLGIPLGSVYWNRQGHMRPTLNIGFQWSRTAAKDLITDNTFRINIGLTFNERWFAKWKVD
jgi:hypothetical protein